MAQELRLSGSQIIQAAEQLETPDLDRLAAQIAKLQARRHASVLSLGESGLFEVINRTLSEDDRTRLEQLSLRREEEVLSSEEHLELLQLQQQMEALHADRVEALAKLAALRGLTLTEMMAELGIEFPDHS